MEMKQVSELSHSTLLNISMKFCVFVCFCWMCVQVFRSKADEGVSVD